MFTSIAVVLVGAWLIVDSQTTPSTSFTLVVGILVAALALYELLAPRLRRP